MRATHNYAMHACIVVTRPLIIHTCFVQSYERCPTSASSGGRPFRSGRLPRWACVARFRPLYKPTCRLVTSNHTTANETDNPTISMSGSCRVHVFSVRVCFLYFFVLHPAMFAFGSFVLHLSSWRHAFWLLVCVLFYTLHFQNVHPSFSPSPAQPPGVLGCLQNLTAWPRRPI